VSLWLCLRFEQLPLQCLNRDETRPVAVLEKQRVLRANDCARALGIKPGQGTATVRALAADMPLTLLERDRDAEQRCLRQLCCWAYSITPSLHSWREDCLLLEIGSCLSLYRGLDSLLAEVTGGLGSRGYSVKQGLAPTPRAAWLLSHADTTVAMAADRPLQERLAPLPLALLDDQATTVDSLRRAGLHTFGDILALPTNTLGRRCGDAFTRELQQLLGQREDLRQDFQPPEQFSDEYWFGYEVKGKEELQPAVQQLLQSLCRFLRNTQLQTGEIQWEFIGIDGSLRRLPVRSSSRHSDWQNWYTLTGIHLERQQLEIGVEGLALHCEQLQPGQLDSIDLFSSRHQREPLGSLLDRLRSRLGQQAIAQVGCRDEHLPEYAVHVAPHNAGTPCTDTHCGQRPFWLMPQPQPLRQQGGQLYWNGPLQLVYGPERIEDNWWLQPVSRDYYVAEDDRGQHFWVYRDRLLKHWYIQGIFP
jgi:protein ImuB